MLPTDNDFEPPSIPALTPRGFCRWVALEILLDPDEHVGFLQHAIKKWNLKHPETGEAFPPDLPRNVFPREADAEVDRWHESCSKQLRSDAENKGDSSAAEDPKSTKPRTNHKHEQFAGEPKYAYVPMRDPFQQPSPRHAPRHGQRRPDVSFAHVPSRAGAHSGQRMGARSPERPDRTERDYREPPPDERERRRSFSDFPSPTQDRSPPVPQNYSGTHLDPNPGRPQAGRRHSHPRHYSSDDSDDDHQGAKVRRRQQQHSPPPRRGAPPSAPQPPPAVNGSGSRPHRNDTGRGEDLKRRNGNSPLGSIRDRVSKKVNGLFVDSRASERPRVDSRQSSYADSPRGGKRSPQRSHSTRAPPAPRVQSDADSEDTSEVDSSGEELRRRRRLRGGDGRQRLLYREKPRSYELDHELDDDLEPGPRRHRQNLRRPETFRRTSSHADVDRRREQMAFDLRGREHTRDERRRERRSPDDSISPVTGVSGRRYPDAMFA